MVLKYKHNLLLRQITGYYILQNTFLFFETIVSFRFHFQKTLKVTLLAALALKVTLLAALEIKTSIID